jgi:hypothetical protein
MSWVLGLATIGAVASVPFMLQHVASFEDPSVSLEMDPAAARNSEPPRAAGCELRTVLVREGARRLGADRARTPIAIVPRTAITMVDGKPTVFVADRDHLIATPVELGALEEEDQCVLSGLSAGQWVVTDSAESRQMIAARS